MALGDKTYNYNFYGLPNGRIWDTESDIGVAVATLTSENIATYYTQFNYIYGIPVPAGIKPEYNGKIFDESIALWKVPPNCTFASKSMFNCNTGNTLNYRIDTFNSNEDIKIGMAAIDTDSDSQFSGYWRQPIKRFAYDITNDVGLGYASAFISDINYSKFCLYPYIYVHRMDGQVSPQSLSTLKSYIDGNPEIRDVSLIRSEIYRGTILPRTKDNWYVPSDDVNYPSLPRKCSPILDTLSPFPIASNATSIKDYIKYNSDNPQEPLDYDDTKTYAPFMYQIGQGLFGSETTTTNRMHDMGLFFNRTVSSWKSGLATVPNTGGTKTSTYYCRYNSRRQDFNDVSYHWSLHMYYLEGNYDIESGTDISNLPNGNHIVVWTKLEIDDYKGKSKGEASLRAVLHEIAFMGLYFTNSELKAQNINFETDDLTGIYCPVFENGTTTGEYRTGDEIKALPNWKSSSVSEPAFESDSEFSDSSPELSNIAFADIMSSGRTYCLLDSYEKLLDNIDLIPSEVSGEKSSDYYFFGADPYDYIIGYYKIPVMFFPENFLDSIDLLSRENIKLGKWSTNNQEIPATQRADGVPLKMRTPIRRVFIPFTYIPRKFNNFLDYEPYTKMTLFLPYYGSIELPPSLFVGHNILVDTLLDLLSGRVTFLIYCDYIQYTSVSCNCRIEIPITSEDISSYTETIIRGKQEISTNISQHNARMASMASHAAISGSISLFKGNLIGVGMATGSILAQGHTSKHVVNEQNRFIESNLQRTQPTPQTISLGSGSEGLGNILQPFITFNYPVLIDDFKPEEYGKINGFACYDNAPLSNYKGFTIMENPILDNLNISAEEKEMIRKLLAEGVILPYE